MIDHMMRYEEERRAQEGAPESPEMSDAQLQEIQQTTGTRCREKIGFPGPGIGRVRSPQHDQWSRNTRIPR